MILRTDKAGLPEAWITIYEAATLLVSEKVVWTLGDTVTTLHGGLNKEGRRSTLAIPAIVAGDGLMGYRYQEAVPELHNDLLFHRDGFMCLYCGRTRSDGAILTRDHIFPRGRGGADTWENTVASCFACNNRKGCRTPQEAGMKLLAVPYSPNFAEAMILKNRRIIADQMAFLLRLCGDRFKSTLN